jgi:hypothetical protein
MSYFGKPSWYDYKYCNYCGKELIREERPSTISFDPITGKANTYVAISCPEYSFKTSNGKAHLNRNAVFDPEVGKYDE